MGTSYHLPGRPPAASWAAFHLCTLETSAFWVLGVGVVMRNRASPGTSDRDGSSHGKSSARRGSAVKRHVRHVSGGALRWGGREPGGWWCAGAHVAGGASAVLPADSAEQAGTNSPRLMCLLSGINSHSSGWETGWGRGGEGSSLSHHPRLSDFFFSDSLHRPWSLEEPVSGWVYMSWVSSTLFSVGEYLHLAGR